MNIIYAGYRTWAYDILKKIHKKNSKLWKISGVITTANPEANFQKLNRKTLTLTDPKKLSLSMVKKWKPDVFLFYGWSWLLPAEFYTDYPCLILHISPLPKFRGGSPIQHQIIAGEKETAATIFQADEGLDSGAIYSQSFFPLSGNIHDIFKRIVKIGAIDTVKVLNGLAAKTIIPKTQDESKATVFKRRPKKDSEITLEDFKNKNSTELYNFIRSLTDPYPNAYYICKDGKKIYFTGVKLGEEKK